MYFKQKMNFISNNFIFYYLQKSFEVLSIIIVISNFLTLELVSNNVRLLSLYFNLSTFKLIVYAEVSKYFAWMMMIMIFFCFPIFL